MNISRIVKPLDLISKHKWLPAFLVVCVGAAYLFAYCVTYRVAFPLSLAVLPTVLVATAICGTLVMFAGTGFCLLPLFVSTTIADDGFHPLYSGGRIKVADDEPGTKSGLRRRGWRVFLITLGFPLMSLIAAVLLAGSTENSLIDLVIWAAALAFSGWLLITGTRKYAFKDELVSAQITALALLAFAFAWAMFVLFIFLKVSHAKLAPMPTAVQLLAIILAILALVALCGGMIVERTVAPDVGWRKLTLLAVILVVLPALAMPVGARITKAALYVLGIGGELPLRIIVNDGAPEPLRKLLDVDGMGLSKRVGLMLDLGGDIQVLIEREGARYVVAIPQSSVVSSVRFADGVVKSIDEMTVDRSGGAPIQDASRK